jgi:TPR repeat protein
MRQRMRLSFGLAALAFICAGTVAQARTLDLAFMPPVIEPQDLCLPSVDPGDADDPGADDGEDGLTDALRLRFVMRDIRRLQAEDADRWFDFLMTLLDWRARLDASFAGISHKLAQIEVYVDAGRLEQLRTAGLIDALRNGRERLNNIQKLALAQYYLNGIGVAPDKEYALGLIRDSAFGGNTDALMSIARMELRGEPMPDWDAPLDVTVTLAFGGMLGQMNKDVCRHAERIAREYTEGDVVTRNADIAYAWYKFAADLGGAQAAWRIVEFHLSAEAGRKDNTEMLHYLQLAVQRGITLDDGQVQQIKSAGKVDEATLTGILGYNFSQDTGRGRPSLSHLLRLSVNLDGDMPTQESPYQQYLREVSRFPTAPGWVLTLLAEQVLIMEGRWAGEREAMVLLEEAVLRDDPEAMQMLASMLVRYRDDPAQLNRAINLLTAVVERFGEASAMRDLDALYRCQAPDAPRLSEADVWATSYRATQAATADIGDADMLALDVYKAPAMLAQIQTQALDGNPTSLAAYFERLQFDPLATEAAAYLWAERTNQSDSALEEYAELEFSLSTNPAERDLALELLRRVYLNNGVQTSLELAVALTKDHGNDPKVAAEIIALLQKASSRGEGAAIRLLSRHLSSERTAQSVFEEYAEVIEERGDFIAMMFAIPFVDSAKADDYIDRAVALMSCGTKDTDELSDASTAMLLPDQAYHWRQVVRTIEGGNVLSRLAISNSQMRSFNKGAAPSPREIQERNLREGDEIARRNLLTLTADPDLPSYDPEAAAGFLLAIIASGKADDEAWVLETYRNADADLQAAIAAKIDMQTVFLAAAQKGSIAAKLDLALLLRSRAKTAADLQASARWFAEAAEGGNVTAMSEFGHMLAYGIGVPQDRAAAVTLLDQAARGGDVAAAETARLLRLGTAP